MNLLTKLIVFYAVNLIVFFLIGVTFGSDATWLVTSLKTWLFPLFVVLVGLFFSFLTIVVQKPARRSIVYNYALIIVSAGTALLLFGTRYSEWKHERDFGNSEANSDYFKYSEGPYEYEKKVAFDTLSTKFNTPNDFRILGSFTDTKDSTVNGYTQTLYSILYYYQKKDDPNSYKAAFDVFNSKANLLYYDRALNVEDYSRIVRFSREVKTTFTEAWRQLPDSVKERIQMEFPDLLE